MKEAQLRSNISILQQVTKSIVADRFKRMAKDEVLSKFISSSVDPILLVDLALQIERESIQLTEISLLEVVTQERMEAEIRRTSKRIQEHYQQVYGEENSVVRDFKAASLLNLRAGTLRSRVDFYNSFLTVESKVETPLELANQAFNRAERFQSKLERVFSSDRSYNDELVRQTEPMHRFLMRKQTDYEILKSEELWLEFKSESFKEPHALP